MVDDRSEGANPVEVPIVHAVPHEKYNRYTYENDIAILGLAYPVGGRKSLQILGDNFLTF